jgi:hypothetical protein
MTVKRQHGGVRKGAGRKVGWRMPVKLKRVKCQITMTPKHFKKTAKGNRSRIVEDALNLKYTIESKIKP